VRFEEHRYQELMRQHHYLGSLPKISETRWCIALFRDQWVALLGFSAAARECAARDQRFTQRRAENAATHTQCPLGFRLLANDEKLTPFDRPLTENKFTVLFGDRRSPSRTRSPGPKPMGIVLTAEQIRVFQ
jgi:hypothetical protein